MKWETELTLTLTTLLVWSDPACPHFFRGALSSGRAGNKDHTQNVKSYSRRRFFCFPNQITKMDGGRDGTGRDGDGDGNLRFTVWPVPSLPRLIIIHVTRTEDYGGVDPSNHPHCPLAFISPTDPVNPVPQVKRG